MPQESHSAPLTTTADGCNLLLAGPEGPARTKGGRHGRQVHRPARPGRPARRPRQPDPAGIRRPRLGCRPGRWSSPARCLRPPVPLASVRRAGRSRGIAHPQGRRVTERFTTEGVAGLLGVAASTIRSYAARGQMPKQSPCPCCGHGATWDADEIRAWISNRPGRTGRPRKS
jgi:predicted DNA-binding transcriptional regulator AlpA